MVALAPDNLGRIVGLANILAAAGEASEAIDLAQRVVDETSPGATRWTSSHSLMQRTGIARKPRGCSRACRNLTRHGPRSRRPSATTTPPSPHSTGPSRRVKETWVNCIRTTGSSPSVPTPGGSLSSTGRQVCAASAGHRGRTPSRRGEGAAGGHGHTLGSARGRHGPRASPSPPTDPFVIQQARLLELHADSYGWSPRAHRPVGSTRSGARRGG